MHFSRLLPVLLLLGFVALPPAHAQAELAQYSVVVPVADTTAALRSDAFASALAQVLTRVAGGQDLRSNAGYADALQSASTIVRTFQYQRAANGMSLQVDFAPGAVRRLISRLGVAAVGVKPPVLLLVRDMNGRLVDQAGLTDLAAAAAARGTNVAYPDAGDTPDFTKLAVADPGALAALTQRYHTGLVLLGKLRADGADWTLLAGGQPQHWSAQGSARTVLFADAGVSVAARVGKELNVVGASVTDGKMWVDGLHSALGYANLIAALRDDPAVRQVSTLGAQDDGVLLYVKAALPLTGVAANLAAGGRVLVQDNAHAGADVTLRWVH